MSDNISKETHEALLAKAVTDATSVTEKALETKSAEASDLAAQNTKLTEELDKAKADNERLNGELDKAQVELKAANDKVAELEKAQADTEAAAAKEKLATERAAAAKNLKVFEDEYVTEKASEWAGLSDDAWNARLEEWQKIRPASTEPAADTASAMTGTTGELTKDPESDAASATTQPKARRTVLGLS